jgi:hypothetical protein
MGLREEAYYRCVSYEHTEFSTLCKYGYYNIVKTNIPGIGYEAYILLHLRIYKLYIKYNEPPIFIWMDEFKNIFTDGTILMLKFMYEISKDVIMFNLHKALMHAIAYNHYKVMNFLMSIPGRYATVDVVNMCIEAGNVNMLKAIIDDNFEIQQEDEDNIHLEVCIGHQRVDMISFIAKRYPKLLRTERIRSYTNTVYITNDEIRNIIYTVQSSAN